MTTTTYMLRSNDKKNQGFGGFQWPRSGPVRAPDWSPERKCGGGLHGYKMGAIDSCPHGDLWLVVEVDADTCVELWSGEWKFPEGIVVYCGDRDGAIDLLVEKGADLADTPGYAPPPRVPRVAYDLVRHVASHTTATSWKDINPSRAAALRLAITALLPFQPDEFAEIVGGLRGEFWLGPERETWYTLACTAGHVSAAVSVERWMEREPFILDGERVYVGKYIRWEGCTYEVTSIEPMFVRAKLREPELAADGMSALVRDGQIVYKPATLREIPRSGFEAKITAQKQAEKARRAAEREAGKADPVDLLPLDRFFADEVSRLRSHRGWGTVHVPADIIAWASAFGTDYRRAWRECTEARFIDQWLEWIGLAVDMRYGDSADTLRKRRSWPAVEQAIYRTIRSVRGLPMKAASGAEPDSDA